MLSADAWDAVRAGRVLYAGTAQPQLAALEAAGVSPVVAEPSGRGLVEAALAAAGDAPVVERMYEAAINVPPALIAKRIAKVEAALVGKKVHVTAPNGTDLTFVIPANAWIHRNTGDASAAKVANARSVRCDVRGAADGIPFSPTESRVSGRTCCGSRSIGNNFQTVRPRRRNRTSNWPTCRCMTTSRRPTTTLKSMPIRRRLLG